MTTEVALWLAGISFCSAVLSMIVAICEHHRANEAERRIVRHLEWHDAQLAQHREQIIAIVGDQLRLAQQGVRQGECLKKLADEATGFQPDFTHISVPGSGRMQ